MFDHLANSGFKPVIFDAYTVGGNTRYNFVWRKSDRPWRAHRDQSFEGFQQTAEKNVGDGFEPVWAESYTTKNGVRYAAVYEKGAPGSYLLKHGITAAQHEEWLDKAKAQGLKPVVASVVSAGGQLRYTVLYRSNNIGAWQLKSQIKEADYQGVFNANKAAGRWPIYAAAYMHQGKPQFSVIFASSGGPAAAGHGLTAQQYQQQYSANTGAGRLTRIVTGYDGAQQNHRYLGVWK